MLEVVPVENLRRLCCLGMLMSAVAIAQSVPETVEAHRAAAKVAAGKDLAGLYAAACPEPAPAAGRAGRGAGRGPRPDPPREEWYAEPAKVFDNLYFIGTKVHGSWAVTTSDGIIVIDTLYSYAGEPEIVEGLKKLGLDPANIKYVVVSHGHGDHHASAKMLQDEFHPHLILGPQDWDLVERDTRNPMPKRDMIATDGEKLKLGDTTLTLYITPGHTPTTISTLVPVKDNGRAHLAAVVFHRDQRRDRGGSVAGRDVERERGVAQLELLAVGGDHVALRHGIARVALHQVPILRPQDQMRMELVLKHLGAGVMIAVAVADNDVLDVGWIEAELLESFDDLGLAGVAVERVDDDDAVGRGNGPGAVHFRADEIQIVENLGGLGVPFLARRIGTRPSARASACASGGGSRLGTGSGVKSREIFPGRDLGCGAMSLHGLGNRLRDGDRRHQHPKATEPAQVFHGDDLQHRDLTTSAPGAESGWPGWAVPPVTLVSFNRIGASSDAPATTHRILAA